MLRYHRKLEYKKCVKRKQKITLYIIFSVKNKVTIIKVHKNSHNPSSVNIFLFSPLQTITTFKQFVADISVKHCAKRRNCSLRAISLFTQSVLPYQKIIFQFHHIMKCCLHFLSIWDSAKFSVW